MLSKPERTNTLRLVNDHMLEDLVLARPVWSCNRQEAMTLAERLGAPIDEEICKNTIRITL